MKNREMFKNTSIANDNVPNGYDSAELSAAGMAILKHRRRMANIYNASSPAPAVQDYNPIWAPPKPHSTVKPSSKKALFPLATFAWMISIAANIWALSGAPNPGLHMMIAMSAIITSLWVSYHSAGAKRRGLHEISAMSAVLAFSLSLYVTTMRFGLVISPITGAGLTALAALGIGIFAHSTMALRLSAIFGALWAGLGFASVGVRPFLWGFPALWSLQVFTAYSLRDGQALILSVLAGYFWLFGTAYYALTAGMVSALQVTTLLFLVGALHVRIGKVMQDRRAAFGLTQTNLGWLAMIAGLIGVQDFWLSPLRAPWLGLPNLVTGQTLWVACAGAVTLCILAVELRRISTRPQSLTKSLTVTLICASLGALAVQAGAVAEVMQSWGLNPMPNLGLFIGAAISALIAAMIVNGIRRGKAIMVLLGLIAALAETVIVFQHLTQNMDHAVFFGAATFVCILFTALFASAADDAEPMT